MVGLEWGEWVERGRCRDRKKIDGDKFVARFQGIPLKIYYDNMERWTVGLENKYFWKFY